MMVLLLYPTTVKLLTCFGDRGCGHPISVKVLRSGTISWAALYSADNSASAVDAYTDLLMEAMDSTAPLDLGIGSSSERKMCAPA